MGRKLDPEELREYIAMNLELAKLAQNEGNAELAREFEQIAQEAQLQLPQLS